MAAPQASSRLEMLQARFQQKQLQEKEQKLLQLYDQQQQRAYQVVQRNSAGSNSSNPGSGGGRIVSTTTTHTTSTSQGGKVRQMFDERRQTTVKGIDRSYPLEPLDNKRKQANTNGVVTQRNGNVTVNRQSVKRVSRADVNSNVNGGKPVVSYHEEISRESYGPYVRRHDDEDEYGVATFANGYYRHEADNEQEEALDQEMMERNRVMGKMHLMGFDESLKHRVRNDLESEEFPEYLVADVPDKLSKRNVTKKLSQAEERLERFKNANAKRSNVAKQSSTTNAVIRKRSEQAVPTKSNSRIAKSPSPDPAATKQRETNARTTRGSTPSSPSKSPDVAPTRVESRNQEAKSLRKSTKGADSIGRKTPGAVDTTDGVVLQNGSPNESTRRSDAFVVDFDDQPSKEDDAMPSKKLSTRKSSNDKRQTASSASGRPISSSNSSVNLNQNSNAKGRMTESERGRGIGKGGVKSRDKETPSSSSGKLTNASFNEDASNDTRKGLVSCKTCGRSFAPNRIELHEEICVKTMTKKRKQFDPVMNRVKGTEHEAFVKKGLTKMKTKKPATKSDWRRKHEDFINTIRYARDTQARLAAGENVNDLPPPPPSDTSDYVQCEHCGRKFNASAAERHIPICKRMQDKKQSQAPRGRR